MIEGICQKCDEPAVDGGLFCDAHRPAPLVREKDPPLAIRREFMALLVLAVVALGYFLMRDSLLPTSAVRVDANRLPLVTPPASSATAPAKRPTAGGLGKPAAAPVVKAELPRGQCGNGVVEAGEQCDGVDLGGANCVNQGFDGDCGSAEACPLAGLGCTDRCTFDPSGCTLADVRTVAHRFIDGRDGTSLDRVTGLVWELKCSATECQPSHDVAVRLGWKDAVGDWIGRLNAERFGGYSDWRLPTVEELLTLVDAVPPCNQDPCPAGAWPERTTARAGYWSSTTFSVDKQRAWGVSFRDGEAYSAEKQDALHVRAVRRR